MNTKRVISAGIGSLATILLFFAWLDFSSLEYTGTSFKLGFAFLGYGLALLIQSSKNENSGLLSQACEKASMIFVILGNLCLFVSVLLWLKGLFS